MPEVARLVATVAADTSDAEAGFARVGASIGGFAKASAVALAAAGAGIVAAGAAAVNSAAGFEQTLSGIKAVSGASVGEMQQMSSLALQIGKDTAFTASEAANAIEELVKGGVSIKDVLGGAATAAVNLAAAGGVSIPEAATLSVNAMSQFSLKGSDMAHVADLIAGAANASAIDVRQFGFSLQMAGAVAATTGFSFDDLAAAIAVMGNAGVIGSDAGTSLKTMMLNLQPTSKEAAGVMRQLGLITKDGANQFFDATGKVKSFAEVAGILQTATAKLTDAQRIQALQQIFGTDAIRAAAIMAKAGAEGFREMAGEMTKVTAASVGAERMNNLRGDLEQLRGSIETVAITFGTALLPALRAGTQWATNFVNGLIPVAEAWGPRIVATMGDISAMIADVVSQGGDLGVLADDLREMGLIDIGPLVTAQRALVGVGRDLVATYNQGGVAGVLASLPSLVGNAAASFLSWAAGMAAQVLPGVLSALGGLLNSALRFVADALPQIATALVGWVDAFIAWIPRAAAGTGPGILDLAGTVAGRILETAGILGTALLRWGAELVGWIVPQIPVALGFLGQLVGAAAAWIIGNAPQWAAALVAWAAPLVGWVLAQIPPLLANLGSLLLSVGSWIVANAPTFLGYLASWGLSLVNWIVPQIPMLLARLGDVLLAAAAWIIGNAPVLAGQLLTWGGALVQWVVDRVPDVLAALGGLAVRVYSWIKDTALPGLVKQIGAWGAAIVDWVQPRIADLLSAAGRLWNSLSNWIAETAPRVLASLRQWGQAFVDWVSPAATAMLEEADKMWSRFSTWIGETASSLYAKLTEWAKQFNAWVGPAIDDMLATWPGTLNRFFDWIEQQAPVILSKLGTWIKAFVDWIGGEGGGDAGAVGQMVQALVKINLGIAKFIGETAEVIRQRAAKWGESFGWWIANDFLPTLPGRLEAIGTAIWTWITDTAGPRIRDAAATWGPRLVEGFKNGIANLATDLWNALKSAFTGQSATPTAIALPAPATTPAPLPSSGWGLPTGWSALDPQGHDARYWALDPSLYAWNLAQHNWLRYRDSGGWGNAGQPYLIGRGPNLPPEVFTPSTAGMFGFPGAAPAAGDTHITVQIGDQVVRRLVARTNTRNGQRGIRTWNPQAAA